MPRKKKEETDKKVVKVVDEVTIEETKVEEVVEETKVEEVVEEVVGETKVEGKGKVVKLTHRVAVYEDGTVEQIKSRKQHSQLVGSK